MIRPEISFKITTSKPMEMSELLFILGDYEHIGVTHMILSKGEDGFHAKFDKEEWFDSYDSVGCNLHHNSSNEYIAKQFEQELNGMVLAEENHFTIEVDKEITQPRYILIYTCLECLDEDGNIGKHKIIDYFKAEEEEKANKKFEELSGDKRNPYVILSEIKKMVINK